jgi:hypothetical protein
MIVAHPPASPTRLHGFLDNKSGSTQLFDS